MIFAVLASTTLAGCAYYQPVPPDVAMPVAVLRDSGIVESGSKAQIFAAVKIDGKTIYSAFTATSQASHGQGFSLTTHFPWREIPIRPMRIQLTASHETGAPIHALASQLAGTFHHVTGEVEFTPEVGRDYVVKGALGESSSVWIEDSESGERVSAVITES
ncbi:MAG: hypothetical protein KDI48_20045 [Xanthomonadales bacterium]|nr:hypothetical protein [Xanthomonadales bacterium]